MDEMLVLTRKVGQSILIGGLNGAREPVTILILEIQQGRVMLGFTAPNGVLIHRREVWIRLQPPGINSPEPLDERKAVASASVNT